MNVKNLIAAALLPLLMPGLAQAWVAYNRHRVNPISDTVYEVVGKSGSGGSQFWCAAGDYARRVLGAGATQRVYLVRGPAPAQTYHWNRAVLFSLSAPLDSDLSTGITLSMTRIGDNMMAAAAQAYCMDDKLREY